MLAPALAVLALAGCVPPPDPAELRALDEASCAEAGFEPGTDSSRLCLLLQETHRRIDSLSRRMDFLESDLSGLRWHTPRYYP